MVTNLTAEGSKTLSGKPDRVLAVNTEVEDYGCHVVTQHATLGPYDFVTMIEAPNDEAIAVLSASLASRGALKILTMRAFPIADFLGLLKSSSIGRR